MSEALPHWGVAFLSEVDGLRRNLPSDPHNDYLSFRHWPGEGSFAIQFSIKRRFRHMVRSIAWKGRCGAVHMFQKDAASGQRYSLYVIGVHNPHGDAQIDTLADVSELMRKRPWDSKVLVVGDFNVDQLPLFGADPFADRTGRSWHHEDERVRLQ